MSALIFNPAYGRAVQFYKNVDDNDPANSALIIMVLAASGLESDEGLREEATFQAVLGGTTNEVTNSGYARKVLTDTELSAIVINNTLNRVDLDIPDQTWTAVAAGDQWAKLVIGYDPDTTTGTDSTIIPITMHDFVVVPDGTDIIAQIALEGFLGIGSTP